MIRENGCNRKPAVTATDIPDGPHWAIIEFGTVSTYSGYEKPGESGGAATVAYYYVFTDEDKWKEAQLELTRAALADRYFEPRPDHVVALRVTGRSRVNVTVTL